MNAPTDWVSAIAILAAGLILGLLFVVFFGKKKAKATFGGDDNLELKDLHAKRDALVQQLRDPGLSPDERQRLELETASVLRQLDSLGSPHPASRGEGQGEGQSASPSSTMNPAIKGFLWGAGSFAALAALGYLVMQSSNPRQEGGSVTGGFESEGQQQTQSAQPDPALQQLVAAVQSNPNDLGLRNDLAQAYLERDNLMAVFEQTKFVLDQSPENSRALTYQALVRMAMGEGAEAEKMLERALASDVKNLDAWVARAWVYAQANRMADAERMIAEASKQSPENKGRLEEVLRQMKANAANPAPAQELPAGHPPIDDAPTAAAAVPAAAAPATVPPRPADGKSVQVTLDLDASAKGKTGVVYIMARNPAGGPPVAVKRLQVAQFPVTFDFGSADSMMGQPLPPKFRLEARLDSDGDAATKPPTDPTAMQADVVPGTTVKLALK